MKQQKVSCIPVSMLFAERPPALLRASGKDLGKKGQIFPKDCDVRDMGTMLMRVVVLGVPERICYGL